MAIEARGASILSLSGKFESRGVWGKAGEPVEVAPSASEQDDSIAGFIDGLEAMLVSEAIEVLQRELSSKLDNATEECLEELEFELGVVGIPIESAIYCD